MWTNSILLKVDNIYIDASSIQETHFGRCRIHDVCCKVCREVLGWIYEYAELTFRRPLSFNKKKFLLQVVKIRSGDEPPPEKSVKAEDATKFLMTSEGNLRIL